MLLWGPIGVVILFLCYVPYSQLSFVCIFGSCFVHFSTSLTCVAIDAKIIFFFFFQEFTIEKGFLNFILGISCSSSYFILFYWFFNELFSIFNNSFIVSLNISKIRQCACSCQGLSNGTNNATTCTVVVWHISNVTNKLPSILVGSVKFAWIVHKELS